MALIYDVKITSSEYPLNNTYKVYYNNLSGVATIYGTSNPAQNISYNTLISGTGLRVSIPDNAFNITLKNEKCGFTQIYNIVSPPAAPTNVIQQSSTKTSVTISWNAVPGASSYKIYNNSTGDIYTTTNTSYTISNIKMDIITYFQVSALNSNSQEGEKSASVKTKTLPPTYTLIHESGSSPNSNLVLYIKNVNTGSIAGSVFVSPGTTQTVDISNYDSDPNSNDYYNITLAMIGETPQTPGERKLQINNNEPILSNSDIRNVNRPTPLADTTVIGKLTGTGPTGGSITIRNLDSYPDVSFLSIVINGNPIGMAAAPGDEFAYNYNAGDLIEVSISGGTTASLSISGAYAWVGVDNQYGHVSHTFNAPSGGGYIQVRGSTTGSGGGGGGFEPG